MLKVSSESWHYRLRGKVFDDAPKDLCSYFWSTVAAAIALVLYHVARGFAAVFRPLRKLGRYGPALEKAGPKIVLALVVCMGVFLIGWGIWAMIFDTRDFFWGLLTVVGLLAAAALIFGLIVLTIAGLVHLGKKYAASRPAKVTVVKPAKPKKAEGDSTWTIFWSFFKAKKRKVCPLIEVTGIEESPAGLRAE